jgi:hypothetical protein
VVLNADATDHIGAHLLVGHEAVAQRGDAGEDVGLRILILVLVRAVERFGFGEQALDLGDVEPEAGLGDPAGLGVVLEIPTGMLAPPPAKTYWASATEAPANMRTARETMLPRFIQTPIV